MALLFVGMFLGIMLRTIVPALKKVSEGQTFDKRYIATAILAAIAGIPLIYGVVLQLAPTIETYGWFHALLLGIIMGIGTNDAANRYLIHNPKDTT